jgi:acetyl esterase
MGHGMMQLKHGLALFVLALNLGASPAATTTGSTSGPTTQRVFQASGPFTTGIAYKQVGEQKLFMLTQFPPGWTKDDHRPCVVLFFGGGWTSRWSSLYDEYADFLASKGLVVLRPDYRLGEIEPCIQDAKSAVRYARQHAAELGVDPQKIVASGGSSGGHLAMATALLPGFEEPSDVSSKPNAVIALCPVLDFTRPDSKTMKEKGLERAKAISPMSHLDGTELVPTLIVVGDKDTLVESCKTFAAKAKELHQPVELDIVPGGRHNFFNDEPGRGLLIGWSTEFLKKLGYLGDNDVANRNP